MLQSQRHTYLQTIYFIHLIFGAIMLYVGIQYFRGRTVEPVAYSLLLLMGFGAVGYHGYWLLNSLYTMHSD